MASKFMEWLIRIIALVIILGVLYFVSSPLLNGNWMDFYIRLFLALQLVITFGVLRLYNAIVQNTKFLIKLREVGVTLSKVFPHLEQAVRHLTESVNRSKSTEDNLIKSLAKTSEDAQHIIEQLKRNTDANKKN